MGSILGSAIDLGLNTFDAGTPKHNGMAPGAKVAFTQIFQESRENIPTKERMFESAYFLGARIHTNSWGSAVIDNSYNAQSHSIDDLVYQKPDYLILFAASNDGEWSQHGATVGSPSTCKNCLSVGASAGSAEDAQATGAFPRLVIGVIEVPCIVILPNDPEKSFRLQFEGSSIFLKDYCQNSNRSLSGLIAVLDLAQESEQGCSLTQQVRNMSYIF